jgi:hypothetical protein
MSEQNGKMVVLESAVFSLSEHLRANGSHITHEEVKNRINRGLTVHWETSAAKSFQDQRGPGWLVDLSDQFNEEMLYAVVRSIGNGTRQVVAVVEADAIEALQKEKKSLPSVEDAFGEPVSTDDTVQVAPRAAPANPVRQPVVQKETVSPDSPVLIIVRGLSELSNGPGFENAIRETHATFPKTVQSLLSDGIKPEQIEIWSNLRRPKVQIAFE